MRDYWCRLVNPNFHCTASPAESLSPLLIVIAPSLASSTRANRNLSEICYVLTHHSWLHAGPWSGRCRSLCPMSRWAPSPLSEHVVKCKFRVVKHPLREPDRTPFSPSQL
eukprot:5753756-Pyramimonas_sp.AAC.1